MPDWNFPISLPKFTDDSYEQQRAEYIAEHGYRVEPPGLGEIIHLGFNREPSDEEWARFRTSELGRTDPARSAQIVELLDKKRAQRDRSLASPIPNWGKNVASVLTTLDDINDTLGTAGVLMRIAARLAPRTLGKLMLGPVGWLFLAADIAGLFLQVMRLPFACFTRKRRWEAWRELNPFSKRSKVLRARKVRRLRISKGEWIEAAQTADNIFGVGLCLGPLMGFAYDILSGTVRTLIGQRVSWGRPPPTRPKYTIPSERLIRNAPALHAAREEMTAQEHLAFMIALNGASQLMKPYFDEWNALDEVDNFDNVLFQAPRPQHPTTKFILEEVGIHEGEAIGWPGLDKDLVTWEELWDYTQPTAATRFMDFAVRNRNSYTGAIGCQNGYEYGMNMLLVTEGYETVKYESGPIWAGYYDYMASRCELYKCGSFGRGGWSRLFIKTHGLQMGSNYLIVTGSSMPSRFFTGVQSGSWIVCKNCTLYIGTALCPVGFDRWVVEGYVATEKQYLELIRLRIVR